MGFPNQWLFKAGGSGSSTASGSSGVNYVSAIFAGDTLSGINTYNDGASATPTDGTGGTATGLSTSLNSSTPLIGGSSLRFSKDGSNRQGDGWSYDFTVDRQSYETSNPLYIQFYYRTSANYVSSDLRVFVYDKDGSTLLTVQDISANSGNILSATGDSQFTGVFYTTSGNNDYRLIWHIAGTTASAWDFDIDNIVVTPQSTVPGAILGSEQTYVPTITGTSSNPTKGSVDFDGAQWWREGENMVLKYTYSQTGAGSAGSGTYLISLPSGYSIDTTNYKINNTSLFTRVGSGLLYNGSTTFDLAVGIRDSTNLYVDIQSASADYSAWGSANGPLSGTTVFMTFIAKVKISNWAASAALSANEILFSTVRVGASGDAASATSGNPIIFPTVGYDNFGAYSNSTGRFTAPRSGVYRVYGALTSASSATTLSVYVNAASVALAGSLDSNGEATFNAAVKVVKGDLIDLRPGGTVDAATSSYFIEEVPDFSVFSAITPVITPWVNYTPTFTGFGTVATHSLWWRRVGDTLHIRGKFTTGTTTATEARISLPNSVTSDSTKVPAIQYSGSLVYDANAAALTTTLIESNVAYMTFGLQQSGTPGLTKINGNTIAGAGVAVSLLFECPISGW